MTPPAPRPAPTGPSGQNPAAYHYGPVHVIMHGNPAFLEMFGAQSVGVPAREAMADLPAEAFELMDRVYREGRALARQISTPSGAGRLVVVPRRDPENGEAYGVATHLRPHEPGSGPTG